jgi:hypothetical protein
VTGLVQDLEGELELVESMLGVLVPGHEPLDRVVARTFGRAEVLCQAVQLDQGAGEGLPAFNIGAGKLEPGSEGLVGTPGSLQDGRPPLAHLYRRGEMAVLLEGGGQLLVELGRSGRVGGCRYLRLSEYGL